MNVSAATKALYTSANLAHKDLIIQFPNLGLTIGNDLIWEESMRLTERILDTDNVEFVGCIASQFEITLNSINDIVKGEYIIASIKVDDSDEIIPLFHGYVDSAQRQSNRSFKKIIAYDALQTRANVDIANWYNSLSFPITIKDFRDSLFRRIGIEQESTNLPNDYITIDKQYKPNVLNAWNVIKAICQINGAFGIINRYGNFEYRILQNIPPVEPNVNIPSSKTYTPFYPSSMLYALDATREATTDPLSKEVFSFYKNVDYEEFLVKPVDRLTIRETENDLGVSYGSGQNNYIIQGNMFAYKLDPGVLITIAKNIYANIYGITFHPYTSDNNGLPWLECGLDTASYYVLDDSTLYTRSNTDSFTEMNFYIMSRELKGIQALRDSYRATGEENQTQFVSDLNLSIDVIQKQQEIDSFIDNSNTIIDLTDRIETLEQHPSGGANLVSVPYLPEDIDPDMWYFIQGEVVVK